MSVEDQTKGIAQKKHRIVLAEDDSGQRVLMRAFLESDGYLVAACGDGRRALQVCKEMDAFDLLISDLQMPFLNGMELAEAVCAQRADMPIILISGSELTEEHRALVDEKGWVFMRKPFTVPQMLAEVRKCMGSDDALAYMQEFV